MNGLLSSLKCTHFASVFTALLLFSLTKSVPAADQLTLDQVLADAAFQGLAVQESYGSGKPVDGIGKLVIDLEKRQMHLTSFNLMGENQFGAEATIINQNFEISEVERIDPQKIVMKGKNEWEYSFMASLSTIDGKLEFLLVVEGRGRREIRDINKEGRTLKKKYTPGVHLGLGDQ